MKGRKKTTGRCETREELCREVWSRWYETKSSQADIAVALRVSAGVVHSILKNHEGFVEYAVVDGEKG